MTDPLRKLFDDLVADEPPLQTTADSAVAAGRRQQRRNRTLWTATGAALTVAAVAVLPQLFRLSPLSNQPADPSAAASASVPVDPSRTPEPNPSTDPVPPPDLVLTPYEVCPSAAVPAQPDGSVLPETGAATAAALAEGARVAPGMEFAVYHASTSTGPNLNGAPRLTIILDVGDATGWGSVNFQIFPEYDAPAAERALRGANVSSCVEGSRYDFEDGSVAVHYPYGPPEQEATVTHVWYYATGGFTMNIGLFPQAWPTDDDSNPDTPAVPSPRPARGAMPLTIDQVMQIAHAVAQAT